MFAMTLDTALNLSWLIAGVVSLIALSVREARHSRRTTNRARRLRFTALVIVALALFPSVSSSDDLFNFSFINSHLGKHGSFGSSIPEDSKEKAGLQLFRLLETLSQYEIAQVYALSLALCCIALVLTLRREVVTRTVLCSPGRAPPQA